MRDRYYILGVVALLVLFVLVAISLVYMYYSTWLPEIQVSDDNTECSEKGIYLLNYTRRYEDVEFNEIRKLKVEYLGDVKDCQRTKFLNLTEMECRVPTKTNEKDCFIVTVNSSKDCCYIEPMENCWS